MKKFFFLILTVLLGGCADSSHVLVLDYNDFGPQAASYELIGVGWYQWDPHGDSHPETKYDIGVVVYDKSMRPDEVRSRFPVIPEKQQDYRYLPLSSALKYIDATSEESKRLEDEPGQFSVMRNRLHATREKLVEHFKTSDGR